MMRYVIEIPEGEELSPRLKEDAEGFVEIMYLGKCYYYPLTKEFKRLFKIKIEDGRMVMSANMQKKLGVFLQDLIAAIYIQIRNTIGSEVYSKLSREMSDGLEKLYAGTLGKAIESGLSDKMLLEKSE